MPSAQLTMSTEDKSLCTGTSYFSGSIERTRGSCTYWRGMYGLVVGCNDEKVQRVFLVCEILKAEGADHLERPAEIIITVWNHNRIPYRVTQRTKT